MSGRRTAPASAPSPPSATQTTRRARSSFSSSTPPSTSSRRCRPTAYVVYDGSTLIPLTCCSGSQALVSHPATLRPTARLRSSMRWRSSMVRSPSSSAPGALSTKCTMPLRSRVARRPDSSSLSRQVSCFFLKAATLLTTLRSRRILKLPVVGHQVRGEEQEQLKARVESQAERTWRDEDVSSKSVVHSAVGAIGHSA